MGKANERIDISGLNLLDVLIAFYRHAGTAGIGALECGARIMAGTDVLTPTEADNAFRRAWEKNHKGEVMYFFDYIKGRRMKLLMRSDLTMDTSAYEELSTKTGAEIIGELRAAQP